MSAEFFNVTLPVLGDFKAALITAVIVLVVTVQEGKSSSIRVTDTRRDETSYHKVKINIMYCL